MSPKTAISLLAAAVFLLAGAALLPAADEVPTTDNSLASPSTVATARPAESASLSDSAASAENRRKELDAEATSLAEQMSRELGPAYSTKIDDARHIVYVSALDARMLQRVMEVLGQRQDALQRLLFHDPLRWNVVIVLPTLGDYRKVNNDEKILGRYNAVTRTLYSISVSDVLVHEFIHALHHNDQAVAGQHHALWVAEGLATLFQRAEVTDNKLTPLTESSLDKLQDLCRRGETIPLNALCTMPPRAFVAAADKTYPEVRYLMLWLWEQGKLETFYTTYKTDFAADITGRKALETTLGKPMDELDADWRKWVEAQPTPWRPATPRKAHLGVRMEPADNGVRVTGFVRGSAAQTAGVLKLDDIIISLAGQPTPTSASLVAAIAACRPGQTVRIEVIREGRTVALEQILGATSP